METVTTEGERIKIAIKKSGLKQNAIASKMNLKPDTITSYITGKRNMPDDKLRLLAQLCGVSFNWLKTGSLEPLGEAKNNEGDDLLDYKSLLRDHIQKLVDNNQFKEVAVWGHVLVFINDLKLENERMQKELQELKKQNSEIQSSSLEKGLSTSV